MTPQPGLPGSPKSVTPVLDKLRWVLILLVVAGVAVFLVKSRRHRPISTTAPLVEYQQDVATVEKEYRILHGRLLREPEAEQQFQMAADLVRQEKYTAAIEMLER